MLILYSTEGCHLCEEAYSLLVQAEVSSQTEIVDIAFDDELFSRYGVTIPVIQLKHTQDVSLNWPFDSVVLADWLKLHGISNNK
ncbi:glutaredoxin family protein [Thaumasiovibrio sp. DFM-14]|uniref:glutaredoxin family protein n=1 Tax=Thaumasiovibrio sp. DFM-14 TaxID=3384792 RepID=UPI0039A1CE9A